MLKKSILLLILSFLLVTMFTFNYSSATAFTEVEIAYAFTRFALNDVNRNTNLELASKAIDYYIIPNKGSFSFNDVVGPRSSSRGYKSANVIINNKFVPGIGGGICQVSSTLYWAATKCNLQILERHPHSLPVKYIPKGKDATVSYKQLDLRFQNNTGDPIRIEAHTNKNNGIQTIRIWQRVPKY
ncbi:MAG: VanW family protein [Clostridia bacterium]|nr:VanW family protein [Clostridia bacterium]MDD4375299.1 VanW family protein [Clostridia bacterium]